jgi:hypothetical protein
MNWKRSVFLSGSLIVLLCGGVTSRRAGESVDIAAIEYVLDQYGVAWSSNDADKLLVLFTDDVIYEDVTIGAGQRCLAQIRDGSL